MLIGAVLPCFAQHGPIGRAIKATQVTADPSEMEYTTNTVVQKILEDIDDRFGATMPGTNIANAVYNPSTLTWTVDPDYYFSLLSQNTMVAVRNTDITNGPAGGWGVVDDYDAAIGATNLFSLEEGVFTVDQPGYYGVSVTFSTERSVPGDLETEWGFSVVSSTSFTPAVQFQTITEEGFSAGSGYVVIKAEKNDTFYVIYHNGDPVSPLNKIIRVIFCINLLSTY